MQKKLLALAIASLASTGAFAQSSSVTIFGIIDVAVESGKYSDKAGNLTRMISGISEHEPILYFVAPRIYVAHAVRVTNLTPAEYRPQLLWRPESVAVIH